MSAVFDLRRRSMWKDRMRLLHLAFGVAAIIVTIFLILEIAVSDTPAGVSQAQEPGAKERVQTSLTAKRRSFSHYSQEIRKKDLFQPRGLSEEPIPSESPELAAEIAKDLMLRGVILDTEPLAVIEDQKVKKTYFLKVGESIDEYIVQDILEEEVILNYKGSTLKLKL